MIKLKDNILEPFSNNIGVFPYVLKYIDSELNVWLSTSLDAYFQISREERIGYNYLLFLRGFFYV